MCHVIFPINFRYVFVYKHGYQSEDTAISAVITKVKGVSLVKNESHLDPDYRGVWDIQSIVVPPMVRWYGMVWYGMFFYLNIFISFLFVDRRIMLTASFYDTCSTSIVRRSVKCSISCNVQNFRSDFVSV